MKLKTYLFFVFAITVFAIASLMLDTVNYNPFQSPISVFINFYVSLCLSLTGVIGFVIYFTKIKSLRLNNPSLGGSIRLGFLISIAFTTLLLFKSLKILDWWVAGPLIIAVVLLELFFQTVSPIKKSSQGKS